MPAANHELLEAYEALRASSSTDLKSPVVGNRIGDVVEAALRILDKHPQQALVSDDPLKKYICFQRETLRSRAVNHELFEPRGQSARWRQLAKSLASLGRPALDQTLYTAAISFCAAIDLTKKDDKKSPGTYFEILIGHLVSRCYGVNPGNRIQVLNLDLENSLPTDYVFDLGPGKARLHLPVKTSTRERVIQVWAHQRVLDGIYGVGRFRGVLVCLAETNAKPNFGVTEVCLPGQWAIYQMFIAQLHRVYYLDLPRKYAALRTTFPFIPVTTFAEFFAEAERLVSAAPGA